MKALSFDMAWWGKDDTERLCIVKTFSSTCVSGNTNITEKFE